MTIKGPSKTLKEQAISGMMWSSVQRFGTTIISFVANIVLARLLMPEDFGSIGMLMVFIAVSNTLIDGGLGAALIQKKNPTNEDYSTVFYWNLALSTILYAMLFIFSPVISNFYRIPLLSNLLRVQGIILIINAFNVVQSNILLKTLNIKQLAQRDLLSTTIGAVTSIILAFMGFGVWSLVAKMLVIGTMNSIFLWALCKWRPKSHFISWSSFKNLFNYGALLLISSLSETISAEMQSLIIGKVFSARDLGFFTQARKLNGIPERGLTLAVNQVTFPVFSSIQDEHQRLARLVKKSMQTITFINFPIMVILMVIGEPLIKFLLTDKWIEAVPYFRILCFGGMLYGLNSNGVNIMKALGRSNYVLYSGLIKRSITIIAIIIGMQFGIVPLVFGYTISIYSWFLINAFISGKLIDYGIGKQIKDYGINYALSLIMGFLVYFITKDLMIHYVGLMLIQIAGYAFIYIGLSKLMKIEGFNLLYNIIIEQKRKFISG
jgi:teichuronic acid exporter